MTIVIETARRLATRANEMADWLGNAPAWLDQGMDRLFDVHCDLEGEALDACGLEYPPDPDELYEDGPADPDYAAALAVFEAFDPYEELEKWLQANPE